MNEPWKKLARGYREEGELYDKVLDRVREQQRAIEKEMNPSEVLEICREVEGIMDSIMQKENQLEEVKKRWEEEGKEDPEGELSELLGQLEETIQEVSELQENVQKELLQYMQRMEQQTQQAQRDLKAKRAQNTYSQEGR